MASGEDCLFIESMKPNDVIGCAGSAVFLLLVSAWIPFVGPLFGLLTPLPFLYYTTKLGLQQGLRVSAIAVIAIGLIAKLSGYPQIIVFCIEFSLLGIIISEIYKRKLTFGLTVFWGTVSMLFLGALFLFFISLARQSGPLELIVAYLQDNLKDAIPAYENMEWDREKMIESLGRLLARVYPSLMIVGTGLTVWMNIVISRQLFRLGKLEYPEFGSMDRWQAPEHLVWFVIAAGFSLFLSGEVIRMLALNSLIVVGVIYIFHGLSILLFFMNKYGVPPWVRIGIYLLIMFQQIILIGLAMAGLFDQWIDFRKIHKVKA